MSALARSLPKVKTRHVWLKPPLDVGPPLQGYVLTWRKVESQVSPPSWEAYVISVDDRRGEPRLQWIPSVYLEPVQSERPQD